MAYKDKQQMYDYNNNFQKEKYDVLRVLVPKGEGETIKAAAKAAGMSTSAFILSAIRGKMETCP